MIAPIFLYKPECGEYGCSIFPLVLRQAPVPAAQGQTVWFPYRRNRMKLNG